VITIPTEKGEKPLGPRLTSGHRVTEPAAYLTRAGIPGRRTAPPTLRVGSAVSARKGTTGAAGSDAGVGALVERADDQ
jgi:hypothetical protein